MVMVVFVLNLCPGQTTRRRWLRHPCLLVPPGSPTAVLSVLGSSPVGQACSQAGGREWAQRNRTCAVSSVDKALIACTSFCPPPKIVICSFNRLFKKCLLSGPVWKKHLESLWAAHTASRPAPACLLCSGRKGTRRQALESCHVVREFLSQRRQLRRGRAPRG